MYAVHQALKACPFFSVQSIFMKQKDFISIGNFWSSLTYMDFNFNKSFTITNFIVGKFYKPTSVLSED